MTPPAKTAIVTGASAGIGLEIARGLVAAGDRVILAVRDKDRGAAAAKAIGGGEVAQLDVSDLDSVRAFAKGIEGRRIDLLVNNAGIHSASRTRSKQGHEITFATNHLGHFLLTALLRPQLAPDARVVNVASEAHRFARERSFAHADAWSGLTAYTQSKLANILFTRALARRGVRAFAVHPGSVRSGWARGPESGAFRFAATLAAPFLLSPAKGARTPLHACLAPHLQPGTYFVRSKPATPSALARDDVAGEELWELSAKLAQISST